MVSKNVVDDFDPLVSGPVPGGVHHRFVARVFVWCSLLALLIEDFERRDALDRAFREDVVQVLVRPEDTRSTGEIEIVLDHPPDVRHGLAFLSVCDLLPRGVNLLLLFEVRLYISDVELLQIVLDPRGVLLEVASDSRAELFSPRVRERGIVGDAFQTERIADVRAVLQMEFELVVRPSGQNPVDVSLCDSLRVFGPSAVESIVVAEKRSRVLVDLPGEDLLAKRGVAGWRHCWPLDVG